MKKKQLRVQLALVSIGFLLFALTYLYYPNLNKDELLEKRALEKDLDPFDDLNCSAAVKMVYAKELTSRALKALIG